MKMTRRPLLLQAGFTLVELMVSMVIGMFIVLALVALLINVNRNNREMSKTNQVIENGRFALQLLQADISHAGYWGGFIPQFDDLIVTGVPIDYPTAVPDPCKDYAAPWTTADKSNLLGIAVQAYEIPLIVPSPTLSVCANRVNRPKPSTDVLFVRHAANCVAGVGSCPANAGGLFIQVARCGTSLPNPAYVLDNNPASLTLKNRDCTTTAELRQFVSNLYYIRDYAATVGDGIPTLMRSQFEGITGQASADAMIEGIEGFRVEFGVDNVSDSGAAVNFASAINWADANKTSPSNRGDGAPDGNYIHCTTAAPCTVDQLANTVAVKLYVLVRGEKATPGYTDTKTYGLGSTSLGPFNDGFKRHLFTQTVRLTNVSSRRETP